MTFDAIPKPSGSHARKQLPFLLYPGILSVVLSGCMVAGHVTAAAAEPADDLFERHEVATGIAGRQTALAGFFLGGGVAELAVVHRDGNGDPSVRMFGLEGGAWAPVLDATLGPEVLFVDVAEIDGRDRLITYQRGRLSWLDPGSATERPLVDLVWSYKAIDQDGIPRVEVARDLNRDGLDDLLMPDLDGFWVSIQRSDGSFTDAMKLGPPEPFVDEPVGGLDTGDGPAADSRTYGDVGITAWTLPTYMSRVHQVDYDQDGRSDLVFWSEDRFEVHLQEENGLFAAAAVTFASEVPFDSEGVYSRAFEYRDTGVMSILFGLGEKTRRTVLHSLRDLDGDGVGDLVTLALSGRSLLRQRSLYEVHYGRSTPRGTVFDRDAGSAIQPRGQAGALEPWGYSAQRFEDFDGDGRVDALFQHVNIGLGGMMRALIGNSVPINLEIYRSEDGIYPDAPTIKRKIRRFAPFAGLGNVFFPPVLMGDVDGDGRSDLLVGHSPRELRVFLGVPGPELLARRPHKVAVALPHDERHTLLVDLNGDNKQDLLVPLAPTDYAPARPHRLTTLIAR